MLRFKEDEKVDLLLELVKNVKLKGVVQRKNEAHLKTLSSSHGNFKSFNCDLIVNIEWKTKQPQPGFISVSNFLDIDFDNINEGDVVYLNNKERFRHFEHQQTDKEKEFVEEIECNLRD